MAAKVEVANSVMEHVSHTERTVTFSTGEIDGKPEESYTMDYDTWREMGYPHFISLAGRVSTK